VRLYISLSLRGPGGAREKREATGEVGLEKYSKRDVMREVESAVSALASDERDRKALLRDAEKIFGSRRARAGHQRPGSGLLPGWELPKITSQALSSGIGGLLFGIHAPA